MFETLGVWNVALGVVVSMIAAALAIRWLVAFLTRHGLAPFGWYRVALAALLGALALGGAVELG